MSRARKRTNGKSVDARGAVFNITQEVAGGSLMPDDVRASVVSGARPDHDATHQLNMLDQAVTNLWSLLGECGSDARRFRLLALGMTAHIRTVCDQLDGHRSLGELEEAVRFTLSALRSSEANGHDYGTSSLGKAIVKLTQAMEE